MLLTLTACGQSITSNEAPVNSDPVQIANPWRDITEAEAKAICPVSFAVPAGAEDPVWSVMDSAADPSGIPGALIQLSFKLYGNIFTAREQVTGDDEADLSGMYYDWTYQMDEILKNWADAVCHTYRWIGEDGYADLCLWHDNGSGISYSLSVTAEDLDGFDLTAVVESLAAENSKPENSRPDPDDFLGCYTNGSYDTVTIGKSGDAYTMEVSLYRLTTLDKGTVSFTEEGVIFDSVDAGGNPIKLSFYRDGSDRYVLRIDESTWEYLEPGTIFDNMVKTQDSDASSDFDPDFSFTTTDRRGIQYDETVFAGHKLTILNFWEPWCGPCVREMPELQRLYEKYSDKGLQIIGVYSTSDMEKDVDDVLSSAGVTFTILKYTEVFDMFQTGYVPTTVLINGEGRITGETYIGSRSYSEWEALITEYMS